MYEASLLLGLFHYCSSEGTDLKGVLHTNHCMACIVLSLTWKGSLFVCRSAKEKKSIILLVHETIIDWNTNISLTSI
jgi:hypothetical protein